MKGLQSIQRSTKFCRSNETPLRVGWYWRNGGSGEKTGRLSWRVRDALEQGLQSGAGSAAARQRKRNDSLEGCIEGWEGKLRSGLEEVQVTVAGEVEALREEQAKAEVSSKSV